MASSSGTKWVRQVRQDWIETAESWERWEPQILQSLSAVDPHLIRALAPAPRQRLLDFGCGSGEPTLTIAPLVAPGRVVGLDVSPAMLEIARRRARLRDVPNVHFTRGDVAHARLRGKFDRVVARYGLMFVEDVPRTLEHLRRALKPGGRMALAVWGPLDRNPYFRVRAQSVRPFLKEPPPDPERSPHPLRLARPGLLPRLMRRAGFREVRARGIQVPFVFHDVGEFIEFSIGVPGPFRQLYESLSRGQRARVRRRLERGIRVYQDGAALRVPGFAWVVSGRR